MVQQKVVCFVLPSDRGHFLYTIHIARALVQRGYKVEYFAPAAAASYSPSFAHFTSLTDPCDDRFDRHTRLFCNVCSYGDTPEEGFAHVAQVWDATIAEEFPEGLQGIHGPRENLIALKQRVLKPDVALVVYDGVHMYKWIGPHCQDRGVPTLALFPSPYYLYKPEEEFVSEPDNLENEPEYPAARKVISEGVHKQYHPALYTVLPPLAADRPLPKGRRVVGPVFAPDNVTALDQKEAMRVSGLSSWLSKSETPVIYVSFGSMMRGGRAFEIAHRLLPALMTKDGKWRVLIAANPELFEGQCEFQCLRGGVGGNGNANDFLRIEKWVPQSAVLAHPNVKAFVSHCGATSCAEAILSGTPVIGLPFFHDQLFNGPALVHCGGAVANLTKSSFTQDEVRSAISEALSDPVQARLKEMSEKLRSQNALFEVVAEAERAIASARS